MEQFCPWEQAQYFIYSSNIPTLFFYSHIPAIVVALVAGLLVFYKSGKSKMGVTLLTISLLFSVWSIFDLILWATNKPDTVMFLWSMQILIEPLIYLLGFYITYIFVKNTDLSLRGKMASGLLYAPIILFLFSPYKSFRKLPPPTPTSKTLSIFSPTKHSSKFLYIILFLLL